MIVFIVNPVSGNGRGKKVWKEIERVLRQRSIGHAVRFTTGAGTAGALAGELLRTVRPAAVIAVGGDGTVHEIVNGLWGAARSGGADPAAAADAAWRFGYIPAGSGNDFARGHGLPQEPLAALELILAGTSVIPIDLLLMEGRVAANSIGTGLDGQVALETNEAGYKKLLNRLRLGKLAYVLALVRVLLTYRPCDMRLLVDGRTTEKSRVWLIAVCNIPHYGGGMMINPAAKPDDGLAEVCIVSGISRLKLLLLFPLVYSGKHVGHPAVTFLSGRAIEIESSRPHVAHMDGELARPERMRIEVLPAQISVIK
ncbi:diacylglycerol/lipid kinase family protein [Paenibacillus sp. MBLB4367]|uniref:diacylglycerol/lipid kinase family protein n=1 Tax=Paenibacillus sp. MBLB4367 TaxID=3384767 RepID=UPI0039081F88